MERVGRDLSDITVVDEGKSLLSFSAADLWVLFRNGSRENVTISHIFYLEDLHMVA